MIKSIISIILSLITLITVMPNKIVDQKGYQPQTETAYSVEHTNSFGNIISNTLKDDQTNKKTEESEDHIINVDVDTVENVINIDYVSSSNGTVVIDLIDENTNQVIKEYNNDIFCDQTNSSFIIDEKEIPSNFLVKAVLIDDDNEQMGSIYTNEENTEWYEEFSNLETEDFPEDLVVNLDESEDSNFAVLLDSVITSDNNSGHNNLISSDEENGIYFFTDTTQELEDLQKGDIWAWNKDEPNFIIGKVKNVSQSNQGTKVEIEESELYETFSIVKINVSNDECLMSSDTAIQNEKKSITRGSAETNLSKSASFSLSKGKLKGTATVSTGLNFKLEWAIYKLYLSTTLKLTPKIDFSLSVTAKFEKDWKIGEVDIPTPVAGLYVKVIFKIHFEASVSLSLNFSVSRTIGFSFSSYSGTTNLSTNPSTTLEFKISGKIKIGLKVCPEITFVGVAKIGFEGFVGVEISASTNVFSVSNTKRHNCQSCISGTLYGVASLSFTIGADLGFWKKDWKISITGEIKIKIGECHYSNTYREFGWGPCQHMSYLTKFIVLNKDNKVIKNAKIDGKSVGSNGILQAWYDKGRHTVTISASGYKTQIRKISVSEPSVFNAFNTQVTKLEKGNPNQIDQYTDSSYTSYVDEKYYPRMGGGSSGGSYYVEPLTYTEPTGEYTLSTAMASKRSSDVAWVQRALKNLGYSISVDGYYGNQTANVVKRFQDEYGLPVTGKVDADTLSVIKNPVKKVDPPVLRLTSASEMKADGVVTVAWDAVPNATAYDIYVYDSKGNLVKSAIDTKATNAAFTLYLPDTYTIKGRAKNFRYTSEEATLGTRITLYNKPLVTFLDWDGTVLSRQFVEYGTGAVTPASPERYGYTFSKWDKSYSNVNNDITVNAVYNINNFTVTFFLDKDGKQTTTMKCDFETAATAPSEDQLKIQSGYSFAGWDKDFSKIVEDTVIRPVFKWENEDLPIIIDNYSVTPDAGYGYNVNVDIRNYDIRRTNGRVVVALKSGDDRFVTMTESDAFTLAKSATESLEIFVPCKDEVSSVDIFVVNSYSKLIPISETMHYEVSLTDVNENATHNVSGNAGAENAGKQAILFIYKIGDAADFTNEYIGQTVISEDGSYSFDYCLREEPTIQTGDFVVTIGIEGHNTELFLEKIDAPKPVYTVTFKDFDGSIIKSEEVTEGEHATLPQDNPEREGYIFAGWDYTNSSVYEDLTITAIYVHKLYTVVFIDWTNERFDVQTYYYGEPLITPDLSTLDSYDTIGWEDAVAGMPVTQNMVITAKYQKKSFTVNFYDYNGNIIDSQNVEYGESAVIPSLDSDNYNFYSWDSEDLSYVTSSLEVRPYFSYKTDTAKPTANITSGTFNETVTVELSCADDADIYYSINGSDFVKYTSPISITSSAQLEFYATSFGRNDSESVCEYYAINRIGDESNWMVPVSLYQNDQLVGKYLIKHNSKLYDQDIYLGEYGYRFVGYSLEDGGSLLNENYTVTKEVNVYICRAPETYQVVFKDTNDNIIDTQTVNYLDSAISPEVTVEEPGKIFVGWDTDDFLCVHEDLVVYAVIMSENDVLNITLNRESYSMMEGYSYKLSATVTGETDAELFWSSSDENIATVDENGKITAVSDGIVVITASLLGTEVYEDCYVTVVKNPDMSITLSETSDLVDYDGCICGISPSNNAVSEIKSQISSESITFSKNGINLSDADSVTTGSVVTMTDSDGNLTDSMVLVVIGDVNGDGKADNQDVSHLLKYLVGKETLSEEYLLAADVNADGEVNNKDASMIMRYIVNKERF